MDQERKQPTITTIKALFAKSGNKCAFPGCNAPLVDDKDIFVGHVCHINAVRKKDARHNPALSADYLRSRENLVLFCYPHHKRIDAFEQDYPPKLLREFRVNHEAGQTEYVVPDKALGEAIVDVVREDWMPDLEPVIRYLRSDLEEITHQMGMNLISGLISRILNAELNYEVMRLIKVLLPDDQIRLIEEHEHWIEYRRGAATGAIESHGGSLAHLEHNLEYNKISQARLEELRSRLEKSQ